MGISFFSGRSCKLISLTVLFFFASTQLGLLNVAYAAQSGQALKDKQTERKESVKSEEEKFEEVLERIGKHTKKAVEKLNRLEPADAEDRAIKNDRAELDSLDLAMRQKFLKTENEIKNLPPEIRERHRKFVEKYDFNYRVLKKRLNGLELANSPAAKDREHKKLKKYLDLKKSKSYKRPKHWEPDPRNRKKRDFKDSKELKISWLNKSGD